MYYWTRHARCERLPERSGLSQDEVNQKLNERRYVVQVGRPGSLEEHHLIWDHIKNHLIDVVVLYPGRGNKIVSVLPVNERSGYSEERLARAEEAWRGEDFYKESLPPNGRPLDSIELILMKKWIKRSGWIEHEEVSPLLSWLVFEPQIARSGGEGLLELFRERAFRATMKKLLTDWERDIPNYMGKYDPVVLIKKLGAHRFVSLNFFLLSSVKLSDNK